MCARDHLTRVSRAVRLEVSRYCNSGAPKRWRPVTGDQKEEHGADGGPQTKATKTAKASATSEERVPGPGPGKSKKAPSPICHQVRARTACQKQRTAFQKERRRRRQSAPQVAASTRLTERLVRDLPCRAAGCCPHVPTHRVPLAVGVTRDRTRTTLLGACALAHNPECHGPYDWRFPVTATLAPQSVGDL